MTIFSDDQDTRRVSPKDGAPVDIEAGRRAFIRSVGLGAAGAALFGASAKPALAQAGMPTDTPGLSQLDRDILNFALNLEYLEAEFYVRAAFGRGLADADVTGRGPLGPVSGGRQVNFATRNIRNYAEEIARDEENHVKLLRSVLGPETVARPELDLNRSFTAAAQAAGLIGPEDEFDAFANEDNFLLGAFIFEDVGVTAYKGAAPLIESKSILAAAAGLLAVEAYHAGEVRTILYGKGFFYETAVISDLRDAVDGGSDLDQGIGEASNANIVPTDDNSLVFSRTPQQVLNIVYLSPTMTRGGFFPNGTNGTIR